jgi:hypothetical protein
LIRMSLLRSSLSLTLSLSLALPSVAMAGPPPPPPPKGTAATPDQPPDPNTISAEEKLKWAKKLFGEATAAHEAEDFYNSVIKFEQAYTFAPDKHIFAYNIGQDAWELRDCARVKQYLELFLIKETAKEDLRKKAQELLAKADGNSECVTGGTAPNPSNPTRRATQGPADDSEDPLLTKKKKRQRRRDRRRRPQEARRLRPPDRRRHPRGRRRRRRRRRRRHDVRREEQGPGRDRRRRAEQRPPTSRRAATTATSRATSSPPRPSTSSPRS